MNSSLIKIANSFKIIKHQIPECNKLLFYNAYIYSKLQYGIEVYGQAAASILNKVQTQQNRAVKILYSKDYYTPTKLLHKDLKILLVKDVYKLSVLKFTYRQQNNLLPDIFKQFYIQNTSIHKYNTRQSNGLHVTQPINKHGQNSIKYQGTLLWNSVLKQTKALKNIKSFSKKIKLNFIEKY